jgi:hypothetical protein
VTGTVGFDGLTSTSTAGDSLCLSNNKEVTLRSGNTCSAASSLRYKQDISTLTATSGLAELLSLRPVSFRYTPAYLGSLVSDPNWAGQRVGFIAEEMQHIDPRLVTIDNTGQPDTVRYENITAILTKAVQEIASISEAFKTSLIAWLADSGNGIGNLFAQNITVTNVAADDITAHSQLCVGSTCVTPEEFQAMVAASNAAQPGGGPRATVAAPSSSSAATDTPPVIHINGDNPAIIHIGDSYSDLGATINGPTADLNLDIRTFVNGVAVNSIQVDTSIVATDTIDYVATDQNGLTATSSRTVIIQLPARPSTAPTSTATSSPNMTDTPPSTATTTDATSTAQ